MFPVRSYCSLSKSEINPKTANEMGYSTVYKILSKFKTASGKKLGSRVIRSSKVTNARNALVSSEDKEHLARSMSHSLSTSEKYYDLSSTKNSVIKCISRQHSTPIKDENSEPLSEFRNLKRRREEMPSQSQNKPSENESVESLFSEINIPDTNTKDSSTACERVEDNLIISVQDIDKMQDPDETLFSLRAKKIKASNIGNYKEKMMNLSKLKSEIIQIVLENKALGNLPSLFTKKGQLSVLALRKEMTPEISRLYSAADIKPLLAEALRIASGQ